MAVEITTIEELRTVLEKAYWIETQLELSAEWEAYLTAGEKYRDILFEIAHDSELHKRVMERLCETLYGIDKGGFRQPENTQAFNFQEMLDEEIIKEVMKYEELAHDIYSKLLEHTSPELVEKHWTRSDPSDYFKDLRWLTKEEERHVALLKPYAKRTSRIR